jgi:iron complex outermembrane receptor protein
MRRGQESSLRQALVGGAALVALCTSIAWAQEADISIPAQPLSQTLKEISQRTGENILFTPESVFGLRAPPLNGKMSAGDAIARALAGSGLEATSDGSGGFIIQRPAPRKMHAAFEEGLQPSDTETVIVTGSRIPQTGLTSASPVVVVGRQELKFEGTTDVTTLVNNLPETFVSQNANVSNGATGTDNVNLRGLGPSRTLVLIDGSRLMPGDPVDPAPDVNTIPAALVDRIEVETGGASAVYGSDALAGVVNFILRKDFEGIELDGTYSVSQNDNSTARWRELTQAQIDQGSPGYAQAPNGVWNGQTVDTTLLIGANSPNGKGNVSVYLGYRSMATVLQQSREYSECTIDTNGVADICSGSSEFNHWLSFDNLYEGAPFNFFETGTGKQSSGAFTPFTGSPNQKFNFGPSNYLQRPDTRYTGGFFAHYDVSKELEFYANLMFTEDTTVSQIAPSGLFFGSGTGPDFTVSVNCGNPYMTAQENFTLCGELPGDMKATVSGRTYWNGAGNDPALTGNPDGIAGQANLFIARRDLEGGNRQFELQHASYRMQIGIKGDLDPGWSYNLYAQEGFANYSQASTGNFSASRVQNALQVDPATGKCYATEGRLGTDPNCVPLDIFNGIGSITPGMLRYVATSTLQTGWTEEKIVSGSMTGDLGAWGARSPLAQAPAVMVLGAEYRQEGLAFNPDGESQSGDIEGSLPIPAVPAAGFDVREGFSEIQLPLVQNVPFVEDLTLKGGYRYSSYSTAGGTNTWYGAAQWEPLDDLRFRASMQRAVRAPNVLELFTPHTIEGFSTFYPGSDPCATITTGECATVPNAGGNLLFCPSSACNEQIGGNIQLKPETSNTRSFGLVFTPTFLDGFTATADFWGIDVTKYIATLPAAQILDECYGPAATPGSEAYFCPFVHRNSSGMLYGAGYVTSDGINTGYLKTRGVDFEIDYQADTADLWGLNEGTVSLNLVGTWLDELTTEAVPVTPFTSAIASQSSYNCAGLYGTICGTPAPRWRHKLRLTWSSPFGVQVSMQWRYIGSAALDADTSNQLLGGGPGITPCGRFSVAGQGDCTDARIGSYSYFDLSADWDVREGVELRGGVNNIFDIEPPIVSQSVLAPPLGNGNTYTGMYDTLGRTVFVAATIKY